MGSPFVFVLDLSFGRDFVQLWTMDLTNETAEKKNVHTR